MYKQYKTVLAGIIFLCAPTAALAEITLTDAAIVLVPTVLGACGGYGAVKYSIQQEREELGRVKNRCLSELNELCVQKDSLQHGIAILKSIKDSDSRSLREIDYINSRIGLVNDAINMVRDRQEKLKRVIAKNYHEKKFIELNLPELQPAERNQAGFRINSLDESTQHCKQSIEDNERTIEEVLYQKDLWWRAKTPQEMTAVDRETINQEVVLMYQNLERFDKQLAEKRGAIKSVIGEIKEVVSDEETRLRNGALVGGAIGGALGVGTLVVAKYDLLERIKPPKISQRERLQIRQAVAMQNARNAELQALMDAQADGAYKSLSDADKAAYCFLNGIDLEAIHDEESRRILQRSMGEWLLNGRPEVELALLGMFAQRLQGDLPLDDLDRVDEISSAFDEVD